MELQVIEQNVIVAAFNNENGIQAIIDNIRSQVDEKTKGVVWDFTKKKDRETVASLAYKVGRSKTAIDGEGKKLKERYTVITNKIDAERRLAREQLEAEQKRIRQPLDDWEQAEKDRVANHENAISIIKAYFAPSFIDSENIRVSIQHVDNIVVDSSYEEYEQQAKLAKLETLEKLRTALAAREKYEADQAELERLRQAEIERQQRERDEAVAREAADKARLEAENKARQEREQAERAASESKEREARLQAEKEAALLREEQLKRQAEEQAKQAAIDLENAKEAERKRIEAEHAANAKAERQAEAERLANVEHMRSINKAILDKFCEIGLDEDQAKAVITAIAKNQVPHVLIKY